MSDIVVIVVGSVLISLLCWITLRSMERIRDDVRTTADLSRRVARLERMLPDYTFEEDDR